MAQRRSASDVSLRNVYTGKSIAKCNVVVMLSRSRGDDPRRQERSWRESLVPFRFYLQIREKLNRHAPCGTERLGVSSLSDFFQPVVGVETLEYGCGGGRQH